MVDRDEHDGDEQLELFEVVEVTKDEFLVSTGQEFFSYFSKVFVGLL